MNTSPRTCLVIGLEFVDPLFSGNGILTHSVVYGLLHSQYQVIVLCTKPNNVIEHTISNRLFFSALESKQLQVLSVGIPATKWKKLDRSSGWEDFARNFQAECSPSDHNLLQETSFDYVFGIDWSANQILQELHSLDYFSSSTRFVGLIFRVFSKSLELHDTSGDSEFYNDQERQLIHSSELTFVLSHVDQTALEKLAPTEDFHVLVPPLRPDFVELTQNVTHEYERKYLLCNVRLAREKNGLFYAKVVQALDKLQILEKHQITPVFIGARCDEEYAQQVMALFPPSTIIINRFLSSDELLEYLAQTVLYFHPPVYEAFGMTIAEAAAVATPGLIHHEHIGATSLLQENQDQIFVTDMTSLDKVVLTVEKLLEDREELNRIGQRAKQRVLEWTPVHYAQVLHEKLQQHAFSSH